MDIATQYRTHFRVAALAPSETKENQDVVLGKVAKLKDMGEDEKWEQELATLQAEVDRLQLKVDAQEETCSADAAPGASIDLAWRLNLLLAKHLNYIA